MNTERDERRRKQSIADFQAVAKSPEGRRFIWEQMGPAFLASYQPGDAMATAYNEGRRTVANELLARLNDHAPQALVLMFTTAAQARAEDEAAERLEREREDHA